MNSDSDDFVLKLINNKTDVGPFSFSNRTGGSHEYFSSMSSLKSSGITPLSSGTALFGSGGISNSLSGGSLFKDSNQPMLSSQTSMFGSYGVTNGSATAFGSHSFNPSSTLLSSQIGARFNPTSSSYLEGSFNRVSHLSSGLSGDTLRGKVGAGTGGFDSGFAVEHSLYNGRTVAGPEASYTSGNFSAAASVKCDGNGKCNTTANASYNAEF